MFGIVHDTTLLMLRPCGHGQPASRLELVELADEAQIVADCRGMGSGLDHGRAERRRAHGLRYFSLREHDAAIASTWLVRAGERFLDEAMLSFRLDAESACLRDVFVRTDARGRGVFATLVSALDAGPLRGCRSLWSCVDASNGASRAAHRRAGFEVAGTVTVVNAWKRLLWRRLALPAGLHCVEYAVSHRCLWIDSRAAAYRAAHLA